MTQRIIIGDMLSNVSTGIIVHGCNAVGVMGSGIALAIRNRWPRVYESYSRHCSRIEKRIDRLGTVDVVEVSPGLFIANAITQEVYAGYNGIRHDGPYVCYDAITSCFQSIGTFAETHDLVINYPLIGAGLAQGDWDIISERIMNAVPDSVPHVLWMLPQ